MSTQVSPRFVADKTLGRLARWLRILGCDVLHGPNFSGHGLLAAARRDRRVVLTRDRRLAARANLPQSLFVEADRFRGQLRQVVDAFDIDVGAGLFRRCVECNGELAEVSGEEVRGEVPDFVQSTQETFHRCRRCRHVYWNATHVTRVRHELEGMGLAVSAASDGSVR